MITNTLAHLEIRSDVQKNYPFNLAIVGAWHFVSMNILIVPTAIYTVVSLSSDICTHCKSLWIKVSAKRPECK